MKDSIEIELPRTIRESIVNNDYYTAIDMLTIRSLSGKYSIILYEVALRYEKVKIPKMSIEEFRELTGTTDCYKDFRGSGSRAFDDAARAEIAAADADDDERLGIALNLHRRGEDARVLASVMSRGSVTQPMKSEPFPPPCFAASPPRARDAGAAPLHTATRETKRHGRYQ